jgi:hypothetical protein
MHANITNPNTNVMIRTRDLNEEKQVELANYRRENPLDAFVGTRSCLIDNDTRVKTL